MKHFDLFPDCGIPENERLYVIGNGFDIHHGIASKYWDFEKWVQGNIKEPNLVGLMDTFFSNDREFWGDIEQSLGEYNEASVTDFCEPECSEDFKYDHPGQWQDGLEGSIPWVFGHTMDEFRDAFDAWVRNIDISNIETDLFLPRTAKYLSFNYTETLERAYFIPVNNVLHIHGSRLIPGDKFVIGHGNCRDEDAPLGDESILYPYQSAYSEVIRIMNGWQKDQVSLIEKNKDFFMSLNVVNAVCVMGLSYCEIDMPYLNEIAQRVPLNCKWLLYYFTDKDRERAEAFAKSKGLIDCTFRVFG